VLLAFWLQIAQERHAIAAQICYKFLFRHFDFSHTANFASEAT